MTQAEMIEAIANYQSLFQTALMSYFSVMSAYLVVAYFVGKTLSRMQVSIATGLYLFMQLFLTWGVVTYLGASRLLAQSLETPLWEAPKFGPAVFIIPLLVLGILAGLKFMWDVRRK